MKPLLVIDAVGLTPRHIGADTPNLRSLADQGMMTPMQGVFPAVTCSAQTSMLTGTLPCDHGIVGNGWYFRDLAEVFLWRQSNQLVAGERIWDMARKRDPRFTVANLFWWYNMASTVDWSLTPRPLYFADGRKAPGIHGRPAAFADGVRRALPEFPLFQFWGPGAGLASSKWIVDSALLTLVKAKPTLLLVYVPHLDYDFQRFGPDDPRSKAAVRDLDTAIGPLIDAARREGRKILVVSEYGIGPARRVIHVNRALREAGLIETTPMLDRELLDFGASAAFAVADHQIAHVYVNDSRRMNDVRQVLERLAGVERVLDRAAQSELGIDHPRSGEFVCIAEEDAWFTYYYWLDDARAPDFARTVDIHKKPGYDPCELFIDPTITMPKAKIGWRVLKKKLGFRMSMDVIGLDASIVKGTHGRIESCAEDGPILISSEKLRGDGPWVMTDLPCLMLSSIFGAEA